MREYPKRVKRLIRDYAARAYEAELCHDLGDLERQFAIWRSGQISARALSDRICAFTRATDYASDNLYNSPHDAAD